MQEIIAESHIKEYYSKILNQVNGIQALANDAKKIGIDPEPEAETHPALDLAERTERIIKLEGLASRYRTLFEELKGNRIKVIFRIFEEILEGKLGNVADRSKRLELAIKTSLMLNTEGVVIAPIEGVPKVTISKNFDGTSYVDIYYAGPIRAAGGTSAVFPLILGDYGRKILGLDIYKPTEEEIERYAEETQLYENIVSRQYKLKPEEVRRIIRGCPVCINGEPTEEKEVEVHRDLERIPSNRIRGGACLVISEGIALKAKKILTYSKMLNLDWSWLEGIIKVGKHADGKSSSQANWKYLEGLAAGRPIFSYPSAPGGFRLRYGRSRTGGIMSTTIHPATMYVLDEFIAIGTQLKNEKPGKATCVYACDSLEGPFVKLKNADVVQLKSSGEAKKIVNEIYEILSLGDILVCYGDFRKLAHPLLPAGYCKEWWIQEANKNIPKEELDSLKIDLENIGYHKAIELSEKFSIPLHPDFIAYYSLMSKNETIDLIKAVKNAELVKEGNRILGALLPNDVKIKNILEKILLEHKLRENKILIEENYAYPFLKTLGYSDARIDYAALEEKEDALQIINAISPIKIRDKAGTFIGARMGRPESSCPREMKGNPHGLFPIGNYGGSTRSINKAAEKGRITIDIAIKRCPKCKKESHHYLCEDCKVRTVEVYKCKHCGRETLNERCNACKKDSSVGYTSKILEIDTELRKATENLKIKMPTIVKGVRGVMNKTRTAEPLEKAILRAKYNLHIFRDGTVRYEMINNTLTHFKPKEINVSISKLHELGYLKDYLGNEVVNEDQIIELMPQDIVICEDAGSHLLALANFLDEELERLYHKEPYYKAQTKEDLIGHLILALAPHTSAAVVGRILGYNKSRGCFAHPYFHQAKRRNCVHPNTKIVIYNETTKKKEIKKIKNVVERAIKKSSMQNRHIINYYIENIEPLSVYALNPTNYRLEKKKIKYFLKNPAPKYWVKIKTSSNKTFIMTPEHRFAFLNPNNKIKIKEARQIRINDRILTKALKEKKAKKKIGDCYTDKIVSVKKIEETVPSYCIEIEGKNILEKIILWGNGILQPRCDGEQDSITLIIDALLNFSNHYLPETRGGRMDAPLVYTAIINPLEIDDEVYNLEVTDKYPLDFYEKTLQMCPPDVEGIETVQNRLGTVKQYSGFKFSHNATRFDDGPSKSRYVQLKTMEDKINKQIELQSKIRAVETKDSIERVLVSHFLPDCIGNIRSFSRQKVRCTSCNAKYRRIPLSGKCAQCSNGNLILTISEGSVIKYVDIAKRIIAKYALSDYLKQRMDLVEKEINSVFRHDKPAQKSLIDFL
ncbi:MAG: DNA polymerase II large subunit [Candidatus Diapherotrites archaeon CG08_land_8_20_14_0_20_34_12]|nr:MAG: DNA polymerase II large subunit [Candidatus Diapherotrites archaeon CG08_land_8_20_14_0_20_34_12]